MPFGRWLLRGSFIAVLVAAEIGTAGMRAQAQTAPGAQQTAPSSVQAPGAPEAQSYSLAPEKLAKAIAVSRIRNILSIVGSIWGLAVLWILLATRAAARLEIWIAQRIAGRFSQGILYFAIFIFVTTLAGLPLDLIGAQVERHYGISVQGWGSFLGDEAKGLLLTLVFGTLVLLLFSWIVRRWTRRYWFGLWVATLPLILLGTFVQPLLEPLFNKFEPLTKNHAALVDELEKVVARTGTNIPPARMFLMQASLKTNGLNAYVSGMGATKRVVVWDTTAGRIPDDEVLFIFGHESAHYVLHHIPKMIAGSSVGLFFVYWGCAGIAAWLVGRFGAKWEITELSSRSGLVVLLFVVSIAGFVLQPINNVFSRHFEHEADVYGQEAVHGIVADPQKTGVSAFNHLGEAWLEDPNPSPLIEFWLYNHPSTQTRANFAAHYDPWAHGGKGQFFEK